MPIHNKSSPSSIANHTTAEIDYHTSEAAKVKRNREQAYFNSYNFDAIEVLPYDGDDDGDDDEDDDGRDSKVANEKLYNSHKRNNVATTAETTAGASTIETTKNYLNLKTEQSSDRYLEQLGQGGIRVDSNGGICGRNVNLKTTNHHNTHGNYSYLQRFAVIFGNNNNTGTSNKKTNTINSTKSDKQRCGQRLNSQTPALCSTSANNNNRELCTIITYNSSDMVAENNNNSNGVNGNGFLLPRAMLKYQSVGISNSMPLAAATVTATPVGTVCSCNSACSSSTRLSGDSNGKLDHNSSSYSRCSSSNSNINAMMTAMAINSAGSITGNKTRLSAFNQHANSHDINTGFTANATTMPTVATTSLTPSLNNSLSGLKNNTDCTKYKKNLSPNSSHTNIIANVNNNCHLGISKSDQHIKVRSPQNHQQLTAHVTPTASDISNSQSNHSVALENSSTILTDLNISKRTLSHQSHYSTDKSGGSSGYYSSNVCSTYSLEEHIYSEPHLDILDLRSQRHHPIVSKHVRSNENKKNVAASSSTISDHNAQVACKQTLNEKISHTLESSIKHTLHQNRCTGYLCEENEQHEADKTKHNNRKQCEMDLPEKTTTTTTTTKKITTKYTKPDFSENLRCLETSIENLDRHLKTFPQLQTQEQLKPPTYSSLYPPERLRSYSYLPTIREGYDLTPNNLPKRNSLSNHNWKIGHEQNSDDSLLDIDLDSFLPDNDGKPKQGKISSNVSKSAVTANDSLDKPSFLSDEQEANHLKCAKYINSCPEDAYRVESDIIAHSGSSVSEKSLSTYVIGTAVAYPKRYEEQLHFENTRELLEDVRDKIRLLTHGGQSRKQSTYSSPTSAKELCSVQLTREDCLPKELTQMIKTLKNELELYLERINHHNELEIRQLCTGLVKNQNIVKMKKAFERRRSCDTATYEAVTGGIFTETSDPPITIHQQRITSIRCASDPNFKMKRKSLNEVFPVSDCHITEIKASQSNPHDQHQHQHQYQHQHQQHHHQNVQLQRNLSFHQPILGKLHTHDASTQKHESFNNGGGSSESNDKQSILDWHRKKPSIWELYYGTNRLQQSLLGKRNGTMITNAQNPSCYPSSRPESDFTLDLPRAEQLRIKMEKEKKFRQRCRLITTFLSLIFFLLTVMVVSLVLTRGKRMFGSMI